MCGLVIGNQKSIQIGELCNLDGINLVHFGQGLQ